MSLSRNYTKYKYVCAAVLAGSLLSTAAAVEAASITFVFDNTGIIVNPLTTNTVPLTNQLTVTLTDVSDVTIGPGGIPETTDTTNILFTIVNDTNADLSKIRFSYDPFLAGAYQILPGTGAQPQVLFFGSDQAFNYGVFDLSFGLGLGPHTLLGNTSTFTLDVKGPLSALSFGNPSAAEMLSFDCNTSGENSNCGNAVVAGRIAPEPATLALFGLGIAAAVGRRRSQRRR